MLLAKVTNNHCNWHLERSRAESVTVLLNATYVQVAPAARVLQEASDMLSVVRGSLTPHAQRPKVSNHAGDLRSDALARSETRAERQPRFEPLNFAFWICFVFRHSYFVFTRKGITAVGKSRGLRVHVLDHDSVVVDTLHEVLDRLGHTPTSIRSPDRLLAELKASTNKVDLVLADLTTLGRDGTALMAEVHERYPNLSFVLMTDRGASLPPNEAMKCGVQAYIRKPVQFSELELLLTRLSQHLREAAGRAMGDTWVA